jgi:CRISPR system Cascade subunit CasB
MSTFIEMLEEMAKKESRVRAVLKRSLAFDPGAYPPVFPYVERRLGVDDSKWKRTVYYLVAGLWALNWREERGSLDTVAAIASSIDKEDRKNSSGNEKQTSIEKRFIALLDADEGQLAHRLRQFIALLKEHSIDFDALLKDLVSWNHPDKFVQINWAKAFYRTQSTTDNEPETFINKENQK